MNIGKGRTKIGSTDLTNMESIYVLILFLYKIIGSYGNFFYINNPTAVQLEQYDYGSKNKLKCLWFIVER